jgi:hypothetical protein
MKLPQKRPQSKPGFLHLHGPLIRYHLPPKLSTSLKGKAVGSWDTYPGPERCSGFDLRRTDIAQPHACKWACAPARHRYDLLNIVKSSRAFIAIDLGWVAGKVQGEFMTAPEQLKLHDAVNRSADQRQRQIPNLTAITSARDFSHKIPPPSHSIQAPDGVLDTFAARRFLTMCRPEPPSMTIYPSTRI